MTRVQRTGSQKLSTFKTLRSRFNLGNDHYLWHRIYYIIIFYLNT